MSQGNILIFPQSNIDYFLPIVCCRNLLHVIGRAITAFLRVMQCRQVLEYYRRDVLRCMFELSGRKVLFLDRR